jgi:large subunit ribosomal protein L25
MSEAYEINAAPRDVVGKSSKKLAVEGQVPAVLYGAGHHGEPLSLNRRDVDRLLGHEGVRSLILHVKIEGKAKPVNAMVKTVQFAPTKGNPLHLDLLAIKMDQAVQTGVTLHFLGESPGVKAGGVFNTILAQINVEALPGDLPEAIEVDISGLDVGNALTLGDITAPKGVTILGEPEEIVASVTAPTKVEEEVVEEVLEEGVEPEVVGEEEAEESGE